MYRTKTASERVAKWDRRYTGDHVKSVIDTDKPIMLENNTAATNDLVAYENATRTVINGEGVSVADVADVLSASRQMWKARNHYAGETLSRVVAGIISNWVTRGIDQALLEKIRNQVYTIPAPSAPVE